MILPDAAYAALIGEHRRTVLERAGSVVLAAFVGLTGIAAAWGMWNELRDVPGVVAAALLALGGVVAAILFYRKGTARTSITRGGIDRQEWFVPAADIDHLELDATMQDFFLVIVTKDGNRRQLELTRSMEDALIAISPSKGKDRPACGRSLWIDRRKS